MNDAWSAGPVFHSRQSAASCKGCGGSLASSSLVEWDPGVGNFFDEYPLSDEGATHLLETTARFKVTCRNCGATCEI